jgi:hypothetical protein
MTLWDGREIPRLGMGCWAIGGPFYAGDVPLGRPAERIGAGLIVFISIVLLLVEELSCPILGCGDPRPRYLDVAVCLQHNHISGAAALTFNDFYKPQTLMGQKC